MCVYYMYTLPLGARRGRYVPWDWMMVNCHVTVGESNPGPLQEQT